MLSSGIADRSDNTVAMCDLDSMSIFFRDRRANAKRGLHYIYHHGVSEEAQDSYLAGGIFEHDPFTFAINSDNRSGRLIHWGENRLSDIAARAVDYRNFIHCHGVNVVGAWVQQVLPNFLLVIGAHCRPGGKRCANVPMDRLNWELGQLSQLVISDLFEQALVDARGMAAIEAVLGVEVKAHDNGMTILSPRERDVADRVAQGKQNKQIAFAMGISELTVENHLRNIFRKLGVHNRTAMTARLFDRPTRH